MKGHKYQRQMVNYFGDFISFSSLLLMRLLRTSDVGQPIFLPRCGTTEERPFGQYIAKVCPKYLSYGRHIAQRKIQMTQQAHSGDIA